MSTNKKTINHGDIGTHSVTITVIDSHGLSDSVTIFVEVIRSPFIASIDPVEGYINEETTIALSGNSFDDGAKVRVVGKPELVSFIENGVSVFDVFVDGDYAYLKTMSGFEIVKIAHRGGAV
ncbi:MAG: IPT/TIG domain-containing protein [bacterium]